MGSRVGGLHCEPPCIGDRGPPSAVNRVGEHEAGLTDRMQGPASPRAPPPLPARKGVHRRKTRGYRLAARPACMDSGCQTWSTIVLVTLPVSADSASRPMRQFSKLSSGRHRQKPSTCLHMLCRNEPNSRTPYVENEIWPDFLSRLAGVTRTG